MKFWRSSYQLFATFCTAHFLCVLMVNGELLDTSSEIETRHKRTLIFLEGINWVQFIAGIGLPIEVKDQSITLGTVMKAFYLLPTNSTDFTHPTFSFVRRRRSADGTRWLAYRLIERFLDGTGRHGDGKACLLRAICECAGTPMDRRTGVMAEIVHAVLTPSSTTEDLLDTSNSDYHAAERLGLEDHTRCSRIFSGCDVNIIDQFTRLL